MQSFSVAHNENAVFIYIDRTQINATRLEKALRHFEYEITLPDHLESVSDEEQAEIAIMLSHLSEDDKKIISRERVSLSTGIVL